jgi:hypothetical protein
VRLIRGKQKERPPCSGWDPEAALVSERQGEGKLNLLGDFTYAIASCESESATVVETAVVWIEANNEQQAEDLALQQVTTGAGTEWRFKDTRTAARARFRLPDVLGRRAPAGAAGSQWGLNRVTRCTASLPPPNGVRRRRKRPPPNTAEAYMARFRVELIQTVFGAST